MFHKHFNSLVNPMILKCADHLQSSAVSDMRQSWIFVSSEISLKNPSIFGSIEKGTPGFEFAHAIRSFLGMQFSHSPVIEILTTPHGVCEMHFPIVPLIDIR